MTTISNKNKEIYVILGMHKSGTTLISMLLNEAGIHMGDFDMSEDYDSGNQLERMETKVINKKLLGCGQEFSLKIRRGIDAVCIPQTLIQTGSRTVLEISRQQPAWGFKDPRTCLVYPYWEQILPEHKIIAVYRHPAEVARHYCRRRLSPSTVARLSKTLHSWSQYNRLILNVYQKKPVLLLNYSRLMSEKNEFQRLERFIGRKIPDIRNQDKYRSKKHFSPYYLLALSYNAVILKENPLSLYKELEECNKRDGGV